MLSKNAVNIQGMDQSSYVLAFAIFTLHNFLVYKKITNDHVLNSKQKAYILSIKASFTLLGISLLMAYKFATDVDYLTNVTETQKLTLIYFSSYLFSDTIIGVSEYHRHMLSLSGYIHHFVYFFLNILAFHFPYTIPMYVLFFNAELPTLLLGMGSFHKPYRNDELFGTTFFSTRIVLHFVYMCLFWNALPIRIAAICAFCLHLFWFYKWTVLMTEKNKLD